jgi:hypothetical protein
LFDLRGWDSQVFHAYANLQQIKGDLKYELINKYGLDVEEADYVDFDATTGIIRSEEF